MLAATGCEVDAWETTYLHVLDPEGRLGPDAVLGWAMGTALRPVLDALPDNQQDSLLAESLRAIVELDLPELQAIEPPRGFGRD